MTPLFGLQKQFVCIVKLHNFLIYHLCVLRPSKLIIADMGCGEAELAQNVKNKVHSFDLCSVNKFVTVADMSQVCIEYHLILCYLLFNKTISKQVLYIIVLLWPKTYMNLN